MNDGSFISPSKCIECMTLDKDSEMCDTESSAKDSISRTITLQAETIPLHITGRFILIDKKLFGNFSFFLIRLFCPTVAIIAEIGEPLWLSGKVVKMRK
jgi:hypothetical protein